MRDISPSKSYVVTSILGLAIFALGTAAGWMIAPANSASRRPAPGSVLHDEAAMALPDRAGDGQSSDFLTRVHVALSIHDHSKRLRALYAVADGLDGVQIRDDLERFAKTRLPDQKEIVTQLFTRWGEIDPQAALEYAKGLKNVKEYREAVAAIVGGWVENDPAAAEKWINELPEGPFKGRVGGTLIAATAAYDLPHALKLASSPGMAGQFSDTVAHALFDQWMQKNPAEAAHAAAQLPEGSLRFMALPLVARQWAEINPREAMAWASAVNFKLAVNPTMGIGSYTLTPVNSVLQTWIDQDPAAAMAWLQALPDDKQKTGLINVSCGYSIENSHDPQAVTPFLMLLPEGATRDYAFSGSANRISISDPSAALAWSVGLKDDRLEGLMLPQILSQLSGSDLDGALREIERLNAGAKRPIDLASLRFGQLSDPKEPETMAAWALRQPGQQPYLGQVLSAWMSYTPDSATAWLNALAPPVRDQALSGMIGSAFGGPILDPGPIFKRSADWVSQISDPQMRDSAAQSLAGRWLKRDPESAREWLANAPISSQLKSQLLQ